MDISWIGAGMLHVVQRNEINRCRDLMNKSLQRNRSLGGRDCVILGFQVET